MVKALLLIAVLAIGALAAPPAGVPAGAKQIEETKWRHTDAQGKAWIYIRTPFGVARMLEDKAAAPDTTKATARQAAQFEVLEVRGDEVVFQRATPFGKARWTRPVTELTDDEKAAIEAAAKNEKK
jgi:hypothetical protein